MAASIIQISGKAQLTFVRMENAAQFSECFLESAHIVGECDDVLLLHQVRVGRALAADAVQRHTETHQRH